MMSVDPYDIMFDELFCENYLSAMGNTRLPALGADKTPEEKQKSTN